ncbi:MAG TPA: glycoside hydrolase family 3 N-terminal domain-containing protein [Aggregatilineaceae bacterium]|nr:glycoside hydrolase family 3 N-terminal domain-containing protein [Aggregatilineaceae bacterium]
MKKFFFVPVILMIVVLVASTFRSKTAAQGDQLAPDGLPGESYFAPFPLTIALDGDLSDWAGVPTVTLSRDEAGVTFAGAADGEYLYFMADVLDNNIIAGQHETDYWNEDSVEFYLNGTGDLTLPSYVPGVAQVTISPINSDLPADSHIIAGVQSDTVGATFTVVKTDTGWAAELAIPLKNDVWEIAPTHGGEIGFQVHLNSASEKDRDTKLIWSIFDTSDRSYQDPSLFGRLIFFEIGGEPIAVETAAVAEPTPVPTSVAADNSTADYQNPSLPVNERVEDLLARMSLDEKIGQMTLVEKNSIRDGDLAKFYIGGLLSGGGGYPATNTPEAWAEMVKNFQEQALQTPLGIPLLYGVDAVHGHNNVRGAVIFPQNIGLGAANDPDLMMRIGQATANEMIATGIYWNYAPVVAVPQDIRWGRTYEAYGENTELVSALGTAYLIGMQGDNLADPLTVLGTPKHYIGDGGTIWGSSTKDDYQIDQGDMPIDEAVLRERYLPPYQAAIEAGAQSIMVSFSSWNGTKMHAQQYLITDVLKGELGFTGFVVSDWGGIDQIDQDYDTAVVTAINAGVDLNMVPYDYGRFITVMHQAVENGLISEERIDDAVRRILTVKFNLGLFEYPYGHDELLAFVGGPEHRALAREAVGKSLTLLKNEGDLLPLPSDSGPIYVGGQAANDIGIQSGGWTIEWQGKPGDITPGTTLLQAIQSTVSSTTEVVYSATGSFDGQAPVCIGVVGERPYAEGVGDDPNLVLPADDLAVLSAMRESCDQLVVVLITGRPLIITDEIDQWDALLVAWLPGTEGQGVADGVFGLRPIKGKLSYTWPRSTDQLPLGAGEGDPLFAFGFGLETEATPVVTTTQSLVVSDFEDEISAGKDEYDNGIGDVTWGDTAGNVTIEGVTVPAGDDLALPDQVGDNTILKVSYDIASYGGFSHVFTDGTSWLTQDWSGYTDLTFWLYGANSGTQIQVEIFDNRAPDSTADSAERWFYRITDDFTGWQFFSIPLVDFQRRTDWQPGGAPDDGLGLTEVNAYAFSFPAGVGAQVNYLDNIALSGSSGTLPSLDGIQVPRPAISMPSTPTDAYESGMPWKLVWSDEFNAEAGTPINSETWTCEIGGHGWGNQEWEYYTDRPENVIQDGEGNLSIVARAETLPDSECWYGECTHTSARCITKDKFAFTYGRVEARLKLPYGQGIWPAFWMLGANFADAGWPDAGEIDIMEFIGKEPQTTYATVHGPGYSGAAGIGEAFDWGEDVFNEYHIWSVEWEPNVIRWYVDNLEFFSVTPEDLPTGSQWVYDHDFFILLNLAVGGSWPGYPDEATLFPQTFSIDWVRVFQRTAP